MKYCRYCGKQIDDDSTFCTFCGKSQTAMPNEMDYLNSVVRIKTKMLSFLHNTTHKLKIPHISIQTTMLRRIIVWSKKLIVAFFAVCVVYLFVASATWGYYIWQEKKWNSQDNTLLDSYIKANKVDTDAVISFENLEEQHIKRDLFDIQHKCSISHKDQIASVLNDLAEKGNTNAQLLLGRYYKYGSYYPFIISQNVSFVDKDKSSYWFYLAAKQGNAEAQGELGHNYKYGNGVKQDFEKAFYWMQKGATNGDAVAQWRLGNIYAYGLGYYTKYFSDSDCHSWWYTGTKFVSAGDSKESISNNESIKEMHQAGPNVVVVQKDIKKALYYWKLASEQGLEEAKESLHKVYDIEENDTLEN